MSIGFCEKSSIIPACECGQIFWFRTGKNQWNSTINVCVTFIWQLKDMKITRLCKENIRSSEIVSQFKERNYRIISPITFVNHTTTQLIKPRTTITRFYVNYTIFNEEIQINYLHEILTWVVQRGVRTPQPHFYCPLVSNQASTDALPTRPHSLDVKLNYG